MRTKIVAAIASGAVGLTGISGLALAGPALASNGSPTRAVAAQSRSDQVKQALAPLVNGGTLTQAQADKVVAALAALRPGGMTGHAGRVDGRADLTAAAKAIGITEAELRRALQSGSSLAQIAGTKNVSAGNVISALVTAATARINQDVTEGRLTQAEANTILATLTSRVTQLVNARPSAHPRASRPTSKASLSAHTRHGSTTSG